MQTKLFPTSNYDEKNFVPLCEQAIRLLILSDEQAPAELFLRGLKHSNRNIRMASISALFRLNARSHIPSIRSLLQDEEESVQTTATWALACWEESVPRKLLTHLPYAGLQEWIAEALPSGWSHLFPLKPALECVFLGGRLWGNMSPARSESENAALFQRLAGEIDPQPLIACLQHDSYSWSEASYVAWKILKAQGGPLPLDILPTLLSRWDDVAWEAALLVGKRRMASASDLLGEMWVLTAGRTHAAITIALDDLKKIDAVGHLLSELQGGIVEAKAAIWGLGLLGQRGQAIPQEALHQMLHHPVPEVRAEAILTLTSLDDMSLAETLVAVNDTCLEPVIASCQAFLALAHTRIDIPVDLLIRELIDLHNGQSQPKKYNNGYVSREALINIIHTLDELHANVPLDILLDTLAWGKPVEPLVIRYWRRHNPGIFAEMMVQAEAFLQHHL